MPTILRPLTLPTFMKAAFFSNNIVHDFQEKSDDEADERTSEEYLRDLDIEFHERALLANSKRHFARDCFSKMVEPSYKSPTSYSSSVSKGFQPKFTPKLIQSSQHAQSSQGEPKPQKDYKAEYKKMKAKLALLKASPPTSQSSKPFQSKNKGLVAEMFDWDEEEVYDDEEETQVKRLKEVDAGRNPNPDVNVRKTIRGLQNPNPEGEHAHAEGDQIGVSTYVGRVSKVSNVTPTSLDETLATNPNHAVGDEANKGNPTSFGELIFGSTMNPSGTFGSNTVEPKINRPTDSNTFSSFVSNLSTGDGNYRGVSTVQNPTGWNMGDQSSSMQIR
ncbi:hypothetical protein Tco_0247380 [Tanacetum coccineum]